MFVSCVTVYVRPGNVQDFIAATGENHRGAVREPGNLRFDVLQSEDDPTRFLLYEAYVSPAAAAAHKETPHYLRWRDTVAPWMAKPRLGEPYGVIFPESPDAWKR